MGATDDRRCEHVAKLSNLEFVVVVLLLIVSKCQQVSDVITLHVEQSFVDKSFAFSLDESTIVEVDLLRYPMLARWHLPPLQTKKG